MGLVYEDTPEKKGIVISKLLVNILIVILNLFAIVLTIVNNFSPDIFIKVVSAVSAIDIAWITAIGAGRAIGNFSTALVNRPVAPVVTQTPVVAPAVAPVVPNQTNPTATPVNNPVVMNSFVQERVQQI